MDCGDFVVRLVVADHTDSVPAGIHQGYNLPWSPHKRLSVAEELELADWVDHLDHCSSLSIEQHPIAEELVSVKSPEDGYVLGVNLREDGEDPRF